MGNDRSWPPRPPFVIGVGGGSCSGKTTICDSIVERLGPEKVVRIPHDAYYRDRPDLPYEHRQKVNYDHPDSLETELLVDHLHDLLRGQAIWQPEYDFARHLRNPETIEVAPRPIILIEGILVLSEAGLREVMDLRVFVDTPADLRVLRRVERDMRERGRSLASIIAQYQATVRPMHEQIVAPSGDYADMIIPDGYNRQAVGTLIAMIRHLLDRWETTFQADRTV